jgi:hypothetical protein
MDTRQESIDTSFYVELVWNREFNWVRYGEGHPTLEDAVKKAIALEGMGDGARVKKTRVIDGEGNVRWAYGKVVYP